MSGTKTDERTFAEQLAPVFDLVRAGLQDAAALDEPDEALTVLLRRDAAAAAVPAAIAQGLAELRQGRGVTFRSVERGQAPSRARERGRGCSIWSRRSLIGVACAT